MMDRYYTPTIEEFYEGFEYEAQITMHDGVHWSQAEFCLSNYKYISALLETNGSFLDSIYDDIRVKCLDKEDIENLGFRYLFSDKDGRSFICFEYRCFLDLKHIYPISSKCCSIRLKLYSSWENAVAIELHFGNGSVIDAFNGIVKNKSELKKILNQTGLNDN